MSEKESRQGEALHAFRILDWPPPFFLIILLWMFHSELLYPGPEPKTGGTPLILQL